jgi:hypothetical protein
MPARRKIGNGPAPHSRCRYCTPRRRQDDIALTLPARSCELKHGLPEERTAFDTGPVLAMTKTKMKMTRQLDDLARNRRLESVTRDLPNSETPRLYLDNPLVTISAAAIQVGRSEEPL